MISEFTSKTLTIYTQSNQFINLTLKILQNIDNRIGIVSTINSY